MSELQDKVALVTGASQGIGRAIAFRLARAGAGVALAAMDDVHLEGTFREMQDLGFRVLRYGVDLTDDGALDRTSSAIINDWGTVDILVNNAGIGGPTAPVHEMPVEGWDRTLAINLRAPFLLSRRFAPAMIKQKSGRIINISSIAGKMAYPLRTPYAASKWALIGLTLTVAQELGPNNIQVNVICPRSDRDRVDRIGHPGPGGCDGYRLRNDVEGICESNRVKAHGEAGGGGRSGPLSMFAGCRGNNGPGN